MPIEIIDKAMSNGTVIIVALIVGYVLIRIFHCCTEADKLRVLCEEYKKFRKD
jgi:hypothetical protein